MIFQNLLLERIIIVAIGQSWPIIYLSIFAYKLLKRTKNRSTITLSTFFLLLASAYLFAFFSIFAINTPFSYSLYIITWYLYMFSHYFFILFTWLLLHIEESVSLKKYHMFMVLYGIIMAIIIWIGIFNGGIRYDETTSWRPLFSWSFAIINWLYITFFLVLPELLMSFKLVKIFKGSKVVIRIKLFLVSSFLEYVLISLVVLYNMLPDNHGYRSIHIYIGLPLGMLAAYFIYRSFGKNIE